MTFYKELGLYKLRPGPNLAGLRTKVQKQTHVPYV